MSAAGRLRRGVRSRSSLDPWLLRQRVPSTTRIKDPYHFLDLAFEYYLTGRFP